ncbi:MAG TPA: MauE/DoxX family redox-associated membrane protein [Amycolatopsis sp.]|nr:MauE/DoxX family redox-associated membrane protein [Amycolatopsis sp.]
MRTGIRLPPPRVLDILGLLVRLGLAAVWLVSGAIKVADPGQFYTAVQAYQLFGPGVASLISAAVPFLELGLGLLVLLGLGTRLVAVVSALLLLAYIAGVAQSWARGLTIDCGCFGGGGQVAAGQTHYGQEILRDTGFLLMAGWLVLRPKTPVSLDRWLTTGRQLDGKREHEHP